MTLRVEDDTAPPCNFSIAQQTVQVNAAPVAVAGDDVRVAVGEEIVLEGGRSYDVDGEIVRVPLGSGRWHHARRAVRSPRL